MPLAKPASSDPLVPAQTPFTYNVGINYESWEVGRTGYSISADLDQISQNFKLIRTYHDAAVGTGDPTTPQIDSTQAAVISWIVKNPGTELVMGTNNNALAQGGYGDPWEAGLMTERAYTDLWVQMLIDAFGSVEKVKIGLKAILLGNELDQNGPPPDNQDFDTYVNTWIPAAFDNLKASLAAAGLGSIPITTTIANYGVGNEVSINVPAYIAAHWGTSWNNGTPFVMFNQYTANNMESTDFTQVEDYFDGVEQALGASLEVFIGETGYSTYYGAANQTSVYQQIFSWLDGQRADGGKTVPIFLFDAYDRPAATPAVQVEFGIYGETVQYQPNGLKPGLVGVIPGWTTKHLGTSTPGHDSIYGNSAPNTIKAGAGDDIVLGLGGHDRLFGQAGDDLLVGHGGRDILRGGRGDDYLEGGWGRDILYGGRGNDRLVGGPGKDILVGGKGADQFIFDVRVVRKNADTILDFNPRKDSILLKQSKFPDLTLGDLPAFDPHITYKKGSLFYDGVKFVTFDGRPPASLDDISIVVYA